MSRYSDDEYGKMITKLLFTNQSAFSVGIEEFSCTLVVTRNETI